MYTSEKKKKKKNIPWNQAKDTGLHMHLYTVKNIFNCTFIYIQKQTILRCKNLSDLQISYSDIGKKKYGNIELTKYGIWNFLCMLLII